MMYELLDIAFILFHTALILFNLLGWIWKATRRWNFSHTSAYRFFVVWAGYLVRFRILSMYTLALVGAPPAGVC
ncbi:MAG: hypothetical protein U5J63_03470 [Fodinibius sp.]|nr:hypothetical protein [Fodinibius sp.]